jgi:uncharacterized protein YaiE (UPF0345 family)
MSQQYENVTVVKKANLYFDGKVSSRTVLFADGTKITLGLMMPGEYEFGTDVKEVMEIQSGELQVKLPGLDEWLPISGTGEFTVPAGVKFQLKVTAPTDYCCHYINE